MVIGFFYFGQGYSLGSLVLLLPIYIRDELNVQSESDTILLSALLLFPWYFKVFFGLLSDNLPIGNYGRRKPYLVLAAVLSFVGWLTLPIHTSANIGFFVSSLLIAFGTAISDTVIDGLGVEITPIDFVSRLQGTAWGSRGLGLGLAGIVSSQLVRVYGWYPMLYVSAFFGISITVVVLVLPEAQVLGTLSLKLSLSKLLAIFKADDLKDKIGFLFLSGASLAIVPLFAFLLTNDFEIPVSEFTLPSFLFSIGTMAGAFVMAIMMKDGENQQKRIVLFGLFALSIVFPTIPAVSISQFLKMVFFVFIGFGVGLFESYQLKVIQEISHETMEGTSFAVWTGFSNLGQFIIGGIMFSQIAELFGLPYVLVLQLSIITMIGAFYMVKGIKRHVLA